MRSVNTVITRNEPATGTIIAYHKQPTSNRVNQLFMRLISLNGIQDKAYPHTSFTTYVSSLEVFNHMNSVSNEVVSTFYDSNAIGKIKDFINGNARVERAWETILSWAPGSVNSIMEIGCGIGYVSWRMSQVFNLSECAGIDISQKSVDIANKLFCHAKLKYLQGRLSDELVDDPYDLIVLMDVYEHIAKSDRASFHAVLRKLINHNTRIILTFPTPAFLKYLRVNMPEQIQPIDEDVDGETLGIMAEETGTRLLHYREISVWSENDYAHAVLATDANSAPDGPCHPTEPLHTLSRAQRLGLIAERIGLDIVKPIICSDQPENYRQFLGQELTSDTVDNYLIRNKILQELIKVLPELHGTVLDIGCGEMPYKPLITRFNDSITEYIGLDIENPRYQGNSKPDLIWNGALIPLEDSTVDCAIATELFEHLPDLGSVLKELFRVIKPGGILFFTVPFLWPLHDSPHDEYRYTPFSLKRALQQSGYTNVDIAALGGWDASLAQMIGLWLKRRPMDTANRRELMDLLLPFYKNLLISEQECPPLTFNEMSRKNVMITGLHGTATKPCVNARTVECPICGEKFDRFLPFGANPRPNALCPSCHALERHRLLWLFLKAKTDIFSANLKFLDIAPSNLLSDRIQELPNIQYLSIDKYSPRVMRNMDLTALELPDNSFDCILCYHVLEHIPEDLKAMRELFRVLKPGAWAIIQVPLRKGPTLEGAHISDPSERKRLFGQEDHIRYYGDDYRQRLESQGFHVSVDSFAKGYSMTDAIRYGICPGEDIYYCTKPLF